MCAEVYTHFKFIWHVHVYNLCCYVYVSGGIIFAYAAIVYEYTYMYMNNYMYAHNYYMHGNMHIPVQMTPASLLWVEHS